MICSVFLQKKHAKQCKATIANSTKMFIEKQDGTIKNIVQSVWEVKGGGVGLNIFRFFF